MSEARKRPLAVDVAELRHGCDLVREAYVGSTGTLRRIGGTRCTTRPCSMMTIAPDRN